MNVNARASWQLIAAFTEQVQDGGAIVALTSDHTAFNLPYGASKGALDRIILAAARELGDRGIRANVVNPDAVIRGSRIWGGEWRQARAKGMGIEDSQLEEAYRQRSLLKRSVLPEDIAEAVCFLAGDAAAKSTGNVLNVDAGNQIAFSR